MPCGRIFRIVVTHPQSGTWLRFGLVGLVNSAFGFTVFAILLLAGFWPTAALVATMIAAIAFNFQTSRRLVFRSPGHVARFIGVYAAVLIINLAALSLFGWCGLTDLESQALLTLPIAAVSFIGQQRFVFTSA